jgi:hypothetical protein
MALECGQHFPMALPFRAESLLDEKEAVASLEEGLTVGFRYTGSSLVLRDGLGQYPYGCVYVINFGRAGPMSE